MEENKKYVVLISSKIASPLQTLWVGSHLRRLQIGLRSWIVEATANLPQHQKQQHWQLRHWLLRWQWQCGSGSGGLHRNGRGQPGVAWLGQEVCSGFALAARATCSRLGNLPQHQKQQHWQLWHWLLRWPWQCGSSISGLHRNGWGQPSAA